MVRTLRLSYQSKQSSSTIMQNINVKNNLRANILVNINVESSNPAGPSLS